MICVDFLILLICFPLAGVSWPITILASLVTAVCAAFAELISKHGYDTVSVPVVAAVLVYLTLKPGNL